MCFRLYGRRLVTPPRIGKETEYCDERVCVCVCVRACVCECVIMSSDHVFGTARLIFTKIFVQVSYVCGSVLLWRRSDMLCTSVFMDDIIFAHKPRLLDVATQPKRSARAALGLAIICVQ